MKMKLTALERQALKVAAARKRLTAEGVDFDRLPSERDFEVPASSGGCGTQEAYDRHRYRGERPCVACCEAHARRNNPQAPVDKDFADECWGRLE